MLAKRRAREGPARPIWKFNLPPAVSVRKLEKEMFGFGATENRGASAPNARYHDANYQQEPMPLESSAYTGQGLPVAALQSFSSISTTIVPASCH